MHKDDEVVLRIREEVVAGRLQPGQSLPSERELSQKLGMSRVTIRNGLAKLVRQGLLRCRPCRGYFLRTIATEPGGEPAGVVAFVHPGPENELVYAYHSDLWAAAREEAARCGKLTVASYLEGLQLAPERLNEFARFAAGVLCDHAERSVVSALLATGLAVVRTGYLGDGLPVDAVVQDDFGGVVQAVKHLYARGHRRIGYLDPSAELRERGGGLHVEGRRAGYVAACDRLGIPSVVRAVAVPGPSPHEDPVPTERLLGAEATALIVPLQTLLPGVRAALDRRGIALREDFGLVVWGRQAGIWSEADYPSHVVWSPAQMGREAVRRLLLRLERPELEPATILIPTALVDRGTGGRGPGAAVA